MTPGLSSQLWGLVVVALGQPFFDLGFSIWEENKSIFFWHLQHPHKTVEKIKGDSDM